jgi:hypothetical protein
MSHMILPKRLKGAICGQRVNLGDKNMIKNYVLMLYISYFYSNQARLSHYSCKQTKTTWKDMM